ncbi:MAG TPA: Chromate resistance protein ChrB [Candidatus Dormibacteraeota bacterium]|jgi:hypothetical protein
MPAQPSPTWLVLAWRLPTGGSTERVGMWRSLRRLGATVLTPGAAALPFTEELEEQLDWLAQEVEQHGGDAWVLPVTRLPGGEERRIRARIIADRQAEYDALREDAMTFLRRAGEHPGPGTDADYAVRLRTENELVALQRRFQKIRTRDYLNAPGRREAATTIDRCLAFRQGISRKLTPVTDSVPGA